MNIKELIEQDPGKYKIRIIPKTSRAIDLWELNRYIRNFSEEFGLESSFAGAGRSADWELARKENGDYFDNKYWTYWAKFTDEVSATRFMFRLNQDKKLIYRAEPPQEAIGFDALGFQQKTN